MLRRLDPRTKLLLFFYWAVLGLTALGLAGLGAYSLGFRLPQAASRGTVVLLLSSRHPAGFRSGPVTLRSHSAWVQLTGSLDQGVPMAPDTAVAAWTDVPAGAYDGLQLGGIILPLELRVAGGRVTPVLVGVEGGRPQAGEVYADTEAVNLGLEELAGQLRRLPAFRLVDQDGRPFDNSSIAGREVVVAAFHTTCTDTCPLYTGLFFELRRELPKSVLLVEATTDPWQDSPGVLRAYAGRIGADWTFVTGTPEQMAAFWAPFTVQLSGAQLHSSALALIDEHGYVRSYFQGIPDVNGAIPASLQHELSPQGWQELQSHGDGWGAPQILDALATISRIGQPSTGGGNALDFAGAGINGQPITLDQFRGRPLLINFWASWCGPCRAELPLIERAARANPRLAVVLINERDSGDLARGYLRQIDVDLPVVLDADGRIGGDYGVAGLPTTFFVRPDDSIESRYVGQLNQASMAEHLHSLGL